MAELLVMAKNNTHEDPEVDRSGCYKRGYVVNVMPDKHPWGKKECLPKFVVIKIPGVPVEKVRKYIDMEMHAIIPDKIYRRRAWQIRWDDLPAGAKSKLADGSLTIKATSDYVGEYDYTWDQIKSFFRNMVTETDEKENLT